MLNLSKKEIKTILCVNKAKNIHKLSKLSNTTYSYQFKVVFKLQEKGFIKITKKGRDNKMILTDKGEELKSYLEKIQKL